MGRNLVLFTTFPHLVHRPFYLLLYRRVPFFKWSNGWVCWLTPVIPALWGGQGRQITWGQEIETSLSNIVKLVFTKIQKFTGHGGTHLQSQLLRRLRQVICLNLGDRDCSEPRSCHCTLAWMTEWDSVSKKQEMNKQMEWIWVIVLKQTISGILACQKADAYSCHVRLHQKSPESLG